MPDQRPTDDAEPTGDRHLRPDDVEPSTESRGARPDDEAPGNFVDDPTGDIPEPNEPA